VRIEASKNALRRSISLFRRKRSFQVERTARRALGSMELPCQFAFEVTPLLIFFI
jgi:hypothetical protein